MRACVTRTRSAASCHPRRCPLQPETAAKPASSPRIALCGRLTLCRQAHPSAGSRALVVSRVVWTGAQARF